MSRFWIGRVAASVRGIFAMGRRQKSAFGAEAEKEKTTAGKAALLINVTRGKEDVHAVSMALVLAGKALEQGHRVIVFFNAEAPVFASSELGHKVHAKDFPSVSQLLRDVLAGGAQVLVCAHCAKVTGVDSSKLMPGIKLANPEDLLAAIKPGMVGLSY